MSKLEFKPTDFDSIPQLEYFKKELCVIVQAKFDTWLESQKAVYSSHKENTLWTSRAVTGYKYRAKLVNIEEVKS